MAEIRELLARAQSAELKGDKSEAVRLLREAAAFYRDRQMLKRAAQMLRQARRVEGVEDDEEQGDGVFGFGESFETDAVPPSPLEPTSELPDRVLIEQRTPQLADPAVEAWCSFCCKPKTEVGPLVAGPAGAFVCADCLRLSTGLLSGAPPAPTELAPLWTITMLGHELPAQRRARERFMRSRSRLALVIGPQGTGKSAWLASMTGPDVRHLEVSAPLGSAAERELLEWLSAPRRSAFLVVRAPVPKPALVLQGAHGEEPVHDTATLAHSVPHLSPELLSRVDTVHAFEHPTEAALMELAQAIAASRKIELPAEAVARLVSLALRAERGAHELTTLLARIPPGTYSA
jgi:hypothetical protein